MTAAAWWHTGLWWLAIIGLACLTVVEIRRAAKPLPDPRDAATDQGPEGGPRNHAEALRSVRVALVELGYPANVGRYRDGHLIISQHEVHPRDQWRAFMAADLAPMCFTHWVAAARAANRAGPQAWQAVQRHCQATTRSTHDCRAVVARRGRPAPRATAQP